jgi:hypothetical protein
MDPKPPTRYRQNSFFHYLFELIVITLGVALGLFADNLRREYASDKKEKVDTQAIVENLRSDIREMEWIIRVRNERNGQLDSLIILLRSKKTAGNENSWYFFGRQVVELLPSISNSRHARKRSLSTRTDLKSKQVLDTLAAYESLMESISAEQERETEQLKSFYPFLLKIYNAYEFEKMVTRDGTITRPTSKPWLRNTEPELFDDFAFYIHQYRSVIKSSISQLRRMQVLAKRMIVFMERV